MSEALKAIREGEMDPILDDLIEACRQRKATAKVEQATRYGVLVPGKLCVGAKVKINSRCSTRYLVGLTGTVTKVNQVKAKVVFDDAVAARRFGAGEISVPFGLLDVVS